MAADRIGDMTKAALEAFVIEVIAKRFQQSDRPVSEILESMCKNTIETKPGQPSIVEMIREDRDR
jgi:hypothetical protein